MSAPGVAAANIEGAVVFSPESFVPRYAMANLTVHVLGRAFNLLEVKIQFVQRLFVFSTKQI